MDQGARMDVVDADHIATRLRDEQLYFPDDGLVAAAVLAQRLRKPVFLEGEPGVGKSTFAEAMAGVLGLPDRLIRLQCHSGLDASQALYDWDFPRQVLTLRAAGDGRSIPVTDLYHPDFLVRRPVLDAFEQPSVLLIDEIDRADDEFEACLLEVLDKGTITIPELRAEHPKLQLRMPFIVLTSNQTREVHDALKRRCIYHWIEHPDRARETEILERKVQGLTTQLAEEIATAMERLRTASALARCPGIAEAIDLANALVGYGAKSLTPDAVAFCAGTVAKHREDVEIIRRTLLAAAQIPGQRDRS
jgi:MoxR-like ATPase